MHSAVLHSKPKQSLCFGPKIRVNSRAHFSKYNYYKPVESDLPVIYLFMLFQTKSYQIGLFLIKGLEEPLIQRISRGSELPEKKKICQTHQDSNLGPCLS